MKASEPRITAGRTAAVVLVLVSVFAATWFVLDRSERRPRWLTVEAPRIAVVGRPLEIRVTLKKSVEATRIVCSLQRAGADRKIRGYLASSGPPREAVGGATCSFTFEVPEREDMAFAAAIIFLSPTGKWQDGTRAVSTKLMPVRRDAPAREDLGLAETRVYRYVTAAESAAAEADAQEPRRATSSLDHPILFIILLATAVLCLVKSGRRRPGERPEETLERTIWLVFAASLVLGAFLELSGIIGPLAAWGRRLAQEQNIYDARRTFQKMIMAAVAAAGSGLSILFIRAMRRPGSHRYLWWVGIGLAAYASVSFVSVLSFHAVDVVSGQTWHGISPIDGARGAGALVSLVAAVSALGTKNEKANG